MRILAVIFALPIAIAVWIAVVLALPAFVLFIVFFIFGYPSTAFTYALLICLAWAYLEHRQLRRGGRRLASVPRRNR
jgi:hypothetical protein